VRISTCTKASDGSSFAPLGVKAWRYLATAQGLTVNKVRWSYLANA